MHYKFELVLADAFFLYLERYVVAEILLSRVNNNF